MICDQMVCDFIAAIFLLRLFVVDPYFVNVSKIKLTWYTRICSVNLQYEQYISMRARDQAKFDLKI